MLPLVESFYSFQGEGKFVGTPSVFIRFGGCNLGCPGFGVQSEGNIGCDSIKAVYENDSWQMIDDLIIVTKKHLKNLDFLPDIVVTGGEPLLHYQNNILIKALKYFISLGHRITFETNATILINFEKYPVYKDIIFSMSVKLENSGEPKSKRLKFNAISAIVGNARDSYFKFVLSGKDLETKEIKEIIKPYKNTLVYCMPMGSTADELKKHDKEVVEFCLQNGYNYVDRIHIRLWDDEEGR